MKKDLWVKLRGYHFDHIVPPHLADRVGALFGGTDASTRAFASKLSRKCGWTPAFAMQAIEEYKKFLFLGNATGLAVTPSRIIDQVWHEHVLFSRAYREFCRDVLGRDFDHHPELLATDDQTGVFQQQFQQTLDAYRQEFNQEPPAEIWGVPKFNATPRPAPTTRPAGQQESWSGDTPLYLFFDADSPLDGVHHHHHHGHDAGGGGGFGGGGASGDIDSHGHHGLSAGGDGGHSGSADSGSSGDSGGSSCSSGSGCSSSCGGGGCGGS